MVFNIASQLVIFIIILCCSTHPFSVRQETRMSSPANSTADYHFITEPKDDLNCQICSKVARDPWQDEKCGKLFCRECIEQHGMDISCPFCEAEKPRYREDKKRDAGRYSDRIKNASSRSSKVSYRSSKRNSANIYARKIDSKKNDIDRKKNTIRQHREKISDLREDIKRLRKR